MSAFYRSKLVSYPGRSLPVARRVCAVPLSRPAPARPGPARPGQNVAWPSRTREKLLTCWVRYRDILPHYGRIDELFSAFTVDDVAMVERLQALSGSPIRAASTAAWSRI